MVKNVAYPISDESTKGKDYKFLPTELSHTSISLLDVVNNKYRLEASAFSLEAKKSLDLVKNNAFGYVHLWGENGLIKNAFYPGRFKREYVSKAQGVPFFLPSQLTEVFPKPSKFISTRTAEELKKFVIQPGTLLMTRSGTIGKCTISSETTVGKMFSDDVIRVSFKSTYDLGYTYAFLQTKVGQSILQINNYGAVIQHIEPEHLEGVVIPNAPSSVKKAIHELITTSFELRDQSNKLLQEAEDKLYYELDLPPLEDLEPEYLCPQKDVRSYSTRLSELHYRLDGSFHVPHTKAILKAIEKNSSRVEKIGDPAWSKDIILPGRFKRVYVGEENGMPFFGGKQLLELNPSNIKYLSLEHHGSRISQQLLIKENMTVVTCSGTIGKVNIVPKHWENWTLNQHVMRVVPASTDVAGYIFAWLNSEYGYHLITRHIYGSVVDEIDHRHMAQVEIPLLKNQEEQKKINDLVLKANEMRKEAFLKEQQAVREIEEILSGGKRHLQIAPK